MATTVEIRNAFSALPPLLSVSPHIWIDYDKEADVLYVSFRKPQQAKDSAMEDNIIYHYDGKELVGLTFLGAQALFTPNEGTNNV